VKRLIFIVALLMPVTIMAQDAEPVPVSEIDTNKDGKISAVEAKAYKDKEATVGDVVEGVTEVVDAAQDLKGKSGTGLALGISLMLAAIFKTLLSLVKVMSGSTGWFAGKRGKAALKYLTLGLGALAAGGAGIFMALGVGDLAWWDVIIVGLSGPGSMVVHELMSLAPGVGKHASVPDPDA
jgi:hypothetical protein